MQTLGYLLIALLVAALLFYGVVALLPRGLSVTPQRDDAPFELPEQRRLVREDLETLRIPVAVRGYRFAETDDLIDRLAAEIVVRDEEIARLRLVADEAKAQRAQGPQQPLSESSGSRPDTPESPEAGQ